MESLFGAILLGLSKAFDLVNHDILLTKLSMYLTSDHTMQWFKSYLSDRSQTCIMSGETSMSLPLVLGVPQGSILGPLFFSIYISDLPLSIQSSDTDMYADDTTIWSSGNMCESIQQSLQENLNSANCWFSVNVMRPNAKKTRQILIGTSQKLRCADKTCMNLF